MTGIKSFLIAVFLLLHFSLSSQIIEEWNRKYTFPIKNNTFTDVAFTSGHIYMSGYDQQAQRGYLLQLDTLGAIVWADTLPQRVLSSVVTDADENIYVAGVEFATKSFSITKWSQSGQLLMDTIYLSQIPINLEVVDMAIDQAGNLIISTTSAWGLGISKFSNTGSLLNNQGFSIYTNATGNIEIIDNKIVFTFYAGSPGGNQECLYLFDDTLQVTFSARSPYAGYMHSDGYQGQFAYSHKNQYNPIFIYERQPDRSYSLQYIPGLYQVYDLKYDVWGNIIVTGIDSQFVPVCAKLDDSLNIEWNHTIPEHISMEAGCKIMTDIKGQIYLIYTDADLSLPFVNSNIVKIIHLDQNGILQQVTSHVEPIVPGIKIRNLFIHQTLERLYVLSDVTAPNRYALLTRFLYARYGGRVSGKIWLDYSYDCDLDSLDYPLKQKMVHVYQSGSNVIDRSVMTNADGEFVIPMDSGSWDIAPAFSSPAFFSGCPANGSVSVTVDSTQSVIDSVNLAWFPVESSHNLAVTGVIPLLRVGFSQQFAFIATNDGNIRYASGVLTATLDTTLIIQSVNPAPDSVAGHTFYWSFDSLDIFGAAVFYVNTEIPANPQLLGDTIHAHATISNGLQETSLTDNFYHSSRIITGSFDPNDKQILNHTQTIENGLWYYRGREKVVFQVRFENTGTDTAFNIYVSDHLDPNLDPASLQLISSSYPAIKYWLEGDRVIWQMPNIMLPDTGASKEEANGYIIYSLNLREDISDTLVNTFADIYFDFNPPVRTESCRLLREPAVPVQQTLADVPLLIWPNPAEGLLNYSLDEQAEHEIRIYDAYGRLVRHDFMPESDEGMIPTWNLPSGFYFLKVFWNGKAATKRFVVAK